MAKFGINDILNAKTKAAGQQAQTEGYKEIYLSPYEVKAAKENTHQKLENIEELADSFLHVGQEQPTVLARVNGEYRIIDGHRRNAANILNLERGHKEYEKVLYRFMDMSEAMYELRLLAGNGYTQELTAYEKTRLVERTKAALIRAKEEDGLGFELYEWQRLYIITGIWQPPEGRLHGRTTAYILRLLLDQSKPLLLYEFSQVAAYADNPFMGRQYQPVPMQYAGWFRHEIRSVYEQLRAAGVPVREMITEQQRVISW